MKEEKEDALRKVYDAERRNYEAYGTIDYTKRKNNLYGDFKG